MAIPEQAPTVTLTLVDTAPGTKSVAVNLSGTEDLVLALNMIARAQVALLEKLAEAARAQAEESRIVVPDLRLVRPGGN